MLRGGRLGDEVTSLTQAIQSIADSFASCEFARCGRFHTETCKLAKFLYIIIRSIETHKLTTHSHTQLIVPITTVCHMASPTLKFVAALEARRIENVCVVTAKIVFAKRQSAQICFVDRNIP